MHNMAFRGQFVFSLLLRMPSHVARTADSLVLSWPNKNPIRNHFYDSGANEGIGFT